MATCTSCEAALTGTMVSNGKMVRLLNARTCFCLASELYAKQANVFMLSTNKSFKADGYAAA